MAGYIKLHRKITEWEWYSDINTRTLFIHLLIKANYKDSKYKGKLVEKGSFYTTLKKLSQESYLTIDEIRTALKHLKNTNEIEINTTNKETRIKVLRYDEYQGADDTVSQTNPEQIPNYSQTIPERTEEEVKNIRNKELSLSENNSDEEKKTTSRPKRVYADDSLEMQLSLLLAEKMKENNPNCRLPNNYQEWSNTFRLLIEQDKREYSDIENIIKFSQYDEFWKTNILSPTKLRKQYDALILKRERARQQQ